MVVGAAPAWNVGKGTRLPDEREKSWESNDFEWTPDVDRDSFERQKEIWRLNRLEERNGLVQIMTKLVKFSSGLKMGETDGLENPFQSIYYTNFQKDGEFGETDLDRMSQRFWRDYLVREIEFLDPLIILPVGKPASEVVLDICGYEPHVEPLAASNDKTTTVVHSYHWSNLHLNLSSVDERVLPDKIAEGIGPLDGTNKYWKAVAMQIDRFL
jgi:hypothetical protein